MLEKLLSRLMIGLLAIILIAAGPLSLGLTALSHYGVLPHSDTVRIDRAGFATFDFAKPKLWQVDDAQAAEVPPAATQPQDAVPVTESQEVVVEWGNWVGVLLKPIQDVAMALIPAMGLWLATLIPGWLRLFFPAARVNELLENAVVQAIASVKGATAGQKLSISVTNDIIRQAALYAIVQAPKIVNKVADNLPQLIQKILARLPAFAEVPAGFTIEEAVTAVTEKSIKAKAKAQGIPSGPKDPLNQYFGT